VRPLARLATAAVVLALAVPAACARRPAPDGARRGGAAEVAAAPAPAERQFTFAWPFADTGTMRPRGGTTRGPTLRLDLEPSAAWRALREPGLSDLERDRRAILAMAGGFRSTFDFLEVMGFRPGFAPDRPYQSWATERVYVLRDEGTFISLQHVLVMSFRKSDGTLEGPFVTKHWRQDWRYQATEMLTYRGRHTWGRETLAPAEAAGAWTQAVFQVDDSPRYASHGRWRHLGNVSSWLSAETWRPLPRREFSVRDDYEVLVGTNRHTITPTGWVHEEANLKLRLDERGRPRAADPVLAKELGLNRYERIADFDWSAGDRYLARTAPFWAEVRAAWDALARRRGRFTLRAAPDQAGLFVELFAYADALAEGRPFDPADAARVARAAVRSYLRGEAAGSRGTRRSERGPRRATAPHGPRVPES
jgi:hypothetical protein